MSLIIIRSVTVEGWYARLWNIKLEKHGWILWGFYFIFRESKVKGRCFNKDKGAGPPCYLPKQAAPHFLQKFKPLPCWRQLISCTLPPGWAPAGSLLEIRHLPSKMALSVIQNKAMEARHITLFKHHTSAYLQCLNSHTSSMGFMPAFSHWSSCPERCLGA